MTCARLLNLYVTTPILIGLHSEIARVSNAKISVKASIVVGTFA